MSRLYEKVESNNFFEIDEERASDLIKGGNGHFVFNGIYMDLLEENKQLKDKLSKIETLIINHNCDTGDIYYKYNSKFLKSELKQRILEIVYEEGSDSDE